MVAAPASRGEERAQAGGALGRHLAESPWLLGDPAGLRTGLEERGITLDLFWNHETGFLLGAGQDGDVAQSGSADFFVRADLARLGVGFGGRVLAHAKANYNRNVNDDAAALGEPIDDADFDEPIYLDQLWYERDFASGRVHARLGYLDQQVAFDRNAYANNEDKQFLNTFLDNSPTVPLEIGLGALLVVEPTRWLELALAAADADNPIRETGFDTAFDGADSWTSYAEATLHGGFGEGRPGALRLGVFRDGAERPVFGRGVRERGHLGLYLSADQRVWNECGDGSGGLGVFVRAGRDDPRVNRIETFWSAGFQYDGPLPGRDRDAVGLGLYQTLPSGDYRSRVDSDFTSEVGVEMYYRVQLTPWLAITPDAQWLHDPGGADDAPDAFVLALRVRVQL
jgi:porin